MLLLYIIIAILIGSVGSVALAGTLLLLSDKSLHKTSTLLVSLAGGTLLGAAYLGMLPRAASIVGYSHVSMITLAGILVFFLTEKIILWRSCYSKNCERHQQAPAQLIIIGDAFHNFIDGIVITAAFFTSIPFGIMVTISVFAHEIPQELADFGILIKNGYSKRKALWMNMMSGSVAVPAGIMAYFAMEAAQNLIPWFLTFSAASFIYIALADLVPQMHEKTGFKDSVIQISLILSGICIIYMIKQFM